MKFVLTNAYLVINYYHSILTIYSQPIYHYG